MTPEMDVQQSYEQMAIVEKHETVIAYLYPIAQNIGRRHGVAKAMFIECLLEQVSPISRGINFLGFRIWPRHKLLRKQSVVGARRKIVRCQNHADDGALNQFIAAWRGHAVHADTCNLFNHLEKRYGIPCH